MKDKSEHDQIAHQLNGPVWNALGSGMYAATTFLLLFFVSRCCGVEAAGVFSMAFTNAQLMYIVGVFGSHSFHMTDYRCEYSFSSYLSLRIFTCLLIVPALLGLYTIGEMRDKLQLTVVLTLFMAVSALAELWQSEFFRDDRLDLSGQSMFFRNLFSVVSFLAVLMVSGSVIASSLAALLANALSTVYFGPVRKGRHGNESLAPLKLDGQLFVSCVPLFFGMFLMTLLPNCSKYIMDFLEPDALVGYFSMILMPVQMVNLLASFIFRPYLKRFAELFESRDRLGFLELLKKNALLIGASALGCTVLAYLLGTQVLGLLYKAELGPYRMELTISVLSGGLLALSTLEYYLLVTLRKQSSVCFLYGLAVVCCLLISLPAVRLWHMTGGVTACFVAYSLLCLLELRLILLELRRRTDA